MAEQDRSTLKTYFNRGDKPTEDQFTDVFDSSYNKTDDPALKEVQSIANGDAGKVIFSKPDESGQEYLESPQFGHDYYKFISENNPKGKIWVKVRDVRKFDVLVPMGQSKGVIYQVEKNPAGDWIRVREIRQATLSDTESFTGVSNYDEINGNWNTASPPNYYARDVGDTVKITFNGTGIDLNHITDDRGGVWRFVADGYDDGAVEFSTYSGSLDGDVTTQLFRGLKDGQHTVVGTFQGDDPSNPPSTGTGNSRGWIKFETGSGSDQTFDIYGQTKSIATDFTIMPDSHKEIAVLARADGSSNDREWITEHSGANITTNTFEKVFFGEDEVKDWNDYKTGGLFSNNNFFAVDSVHVRQTADCQNPNDAQKLAELYGIHSFTNKGMQFKGKIKFTADTDVGSGYVSMVPIESSSWGTNIIDNFGNNIDLDLYDGSQEFYPVRDYMKSVCVYDDSATSNKNETCVGVSFYDTKDTFLYNTNTYLTDSGNQRRFWVEHRSGGTLNKHYNQVYDEADTISTGFEHRFNLNIAVARVPFEVVKR